MKPITPDSPPEDIEAFTQMLPKLASFLQQDQQAQEWLNALGEGQITEMEFASRLSQRMQSLGVELA